MSKLARDAGVFIDGQVVKEPGRGRVILSLPRYEVPP